MTTHTSKPTPLGTLIKLPPEVRDQIYDHVLDEGYFVFWNYYKHHHDIGDRSVSVKSPITFADLEIRCISKALNAEASARLFSNKIKFLFAISFYEFRDRLSPPPNKKATKKMMNVELKVQTGGVVEAQYIRAGDRVIGRDPTTVLWDNVVQVVTADGEVKQRRTIYHPSNMDPRCEASVDHFTGTEIERNKLLVTFDDFDEHFQLFMHTRFFQTLKTCVGFRSIAVVLEWWEMDGMGPIYMTVAERVEEVQRELEQCWGPCVVTDALDRYVQKNDEDFLLYYAFELTFRPLKFLGEKAEAAGAGMIKEADRLDELS